jgi:hypothetical protein
MSIEIMKRSQEQAAGADGMRRTRWCVIRNTYSELLDTTIKTWLMWFPEERFGGLNRASMTHDIKFNDVRMEVLFRALDRPQDVSKLLSMELTGGWINEAREIPKAVVDTLGDRVGQFPAAKDEGCTWHGVMMDTNPPDEDHWWYKLSEEEHPDGWEFFRQPGAVYKDGSIWRLNPYGENFDNLNEGGDYYLKRIPGKKEDYIKIYYGGQYGFVADGRPVINGYQDNIHCIFGEIAPDKKLTMFIGIDFGLDCAAVFGQKLANGRWVWVDELVTADMGTTKFAEALSRKIRGEYNGFKFEIWGDPAGTHKNQVDKRTPFQILQKAKIDAHPAPTNDFTIRSEAIEIPLNRLVDGKPGLIISTKCKTARKGLAGGYYYKRKNIAGAEIFHDEPVKTPSSHCVEAGGYMMIGAGEGRNVIEGGGSQSEEEIKDLIAARRRRRSGGVMTR